MATPGAVIGGIQSGSNFARLQQARRRDEFDQKQIKLGEYNSIVGQAEKTLKSLSEQMAIKRAAAPTGEDQAKVDAEYQEMYKSVITPLSRAGESAMQQGIPVDVPVELARLVPFQQLPDLNAEQLLAAQGAGRKKGAEKQAEFAAQTEAQPFKGGKEFVDKETGQTVILTQSGEVVPVGQLGKLPSTRINVEQALPEEAQPQQPEFAGIGQQVMEDIRQSTGIAGTISKGASRIGGQFVPGTNPRLDAEQRVKNFNQEVKFAFSRNPRFPVSEIERIQKDLLPDPEASFTDPESEANKIPLLRQNLIDLNEADRLTIGGMSEKGRKDALDRMATRQAILELIGDVPPIPTDQEPADARIDALEQKGLDSLTPAELDELERLLQ